MFLLICNLYTNPFGSASFKTVEKLTKKNHENKITQPLKIYMEHNEKLLLNFKH